MKETLKPGIRYEHTFAVPASNTVPAPIHDMSS